MGNVINHTWRTLFELNFFLQLNNNMLKVLFQVSWHSTKGLGRYDFFSKYYNIGKPKKYKWHLENSF